MKRKIIKNIQGIQKARQSSKNHQCVSKQRPQVCASQEEATQEISKVDSRIAEITHRHTEVSKELNNSPSTPFLHGRSDASTQTLLIIPDFAQNDDKESSSRSFSQNLTDDRLTICPDQSICGSSNGCRRLQTSLRKRKIRKYKKCSCGRQCPYALYKLPCKRLRGCTDVPERKLYKDDKERNNFPKFISIDTVRGENRDERPADFLSLEIGEDGTSGCPSSLSVDLEVDVCCDLQSEFLNGRRTRAYFESRLSSRRNDESAKSALTEDESLSRTISSPRNVTARREGDKIDKATEVSYHH